MNQLGEKSQLSYELVMRLPDELGAGEVGYD